MAQIQIQITNLSQIKKAFSQAPDLMTQNLNTAIKQTIMFIAGQAKINAPVRTGYLRASEYTTFGPLRGEIGFNAKYAAWVHDGTSPYIIRPIHAKALYWKGAEHPVMMVNHPGIRANPYLQKAVDSAQGQTDQNFKTAVQNTLDTIGKGTE